MIDRILEWFFFRFLVFVMFLLIIATLLVTASRVMAGELKGTALYQKLDEIHRKVNSYPNVYDIDNYGVEDYFASPSEFYKNGGDCEDNAIAKRYEIAKLGIPLNKMHYIEVSLKPADAYAADNFLLRAFKTLFLNEELLSHLMLVVIVDEKFLVFDIQSDEIQDMPYVLKRYEYGRIIPVAIAESLVKNYKELDNPEIDTPYIQNHLRLLLKWRELNAERKLRGEKRDDEALRRKVFEWDKSNQED